MSHDHKHTGENEASAPALSPDEGHLHAAVRRPMTRQMRRLRWAMAITAAVLVAEVAGGIISHSLALLSDAGHMFTHLLALGISYFAIVLSTRPATQERTFGYFRAEVLVAFVNGLALLAVAGYIFYAAVRRAVQPVEVRTAYMLAVAGLGLVANGASVALLVGISGNDLNLRAAFFHVLYDAISSVAVVAAGAAIAVTGIQIIDPLVSVGIGALIVVWAVNVTRESVHILLEGTPRHLDPIRIRRDIEALPDVHHVHDVHIWQITTNMHVLTAHVVVEDTSTAEPRGILDAVSRLLRERYGIGHTTIQLEYGLAEQEHHGTTPREGEAPPTQRGG